MERDQVIVSTAYQEVPREQWDEVMSVHAAAWQNPELPQRQYDLCAKGELERFRAGESIAPYAALLRCWHHIGWVPGYKATVLDIGAASGEYREILNTFDIRTYYTAVDYSQAFAEFARTLYPDILYDVADACKLPYDDDAFDVVVSSAAIMHIENWGCAIEEAKRVARCYLILNRTPVSTREPTQAFLKEGYGVEMFEWQFNEDELLRICAVNNLSLLYSTNVFWDSESGHRSYLLAKMRNDRA